jgi:hypothetical protein
MHRSGTTMVTKLLESLGVFMGSAQLPDTSEAISFHLHNVAMLELASATWDQPDPLAELLEADLWRERFASAAESWMHGLSTRKYWGRSLQEDTWNSDGAWGWKDPRNTITLPVWLRLFPRARVVNVVRDADAVANSLRVRSEHALAAGRSASLLVLDHDIAIRLRDRYVAYADAHLEYVDASRQLTICYEDVVASPRDAVERLRCFAAPSASDECIARSALSVRAAASELDA